MGRDTSVHFGQASDELKLLFQCVKQDLFQDEQVDEDLCLWLSLAMGAAYGNSEHNTSFKRELSNVIYHILDRDDGDTALPSFQFNCTHDTFPPFPSTL